MSTTVLSRPIDVPRGDRELSYDNARGKSAVVAVLQRRSNMARRRQDAQEIQDALDWMDLHGDEVDAPSELDQLSAHLWDDATGADAIEAQAKAEQAAMLPDFDVLDWYADLHEVACPFRTLTTEDLRGLTVTQMFWGDYTDDDREV